MAKKEFPKQQFEPEVENEGGFGGEPEGFAGKVKEKVSDLGNKTFSLIKIALGICMLPFVWFFAVGFLSELSIAEKPLQAYFWRGVLVFTLGYLFIWEPVGIYARGQKIMEVLFAFIKPLVRVAPYLLPIYSILCYVAFLCVAPFVKNPQLPGWLAFSLGFTLSFHLVFSSKTLRGKKEDFLRSNYMFGFGFVFILCLVILAGIISSLSANFSFIKFFNGSYNAAIGFFQAIFRQLFVVKP